MNFVIRTGKLHKVKASMSLLLDALDSERLGNHAIIVKYDDAKDTFTPYIVKKVKDKKGLVRLDKFILKTKSDVKFRNGNSLDLRRKNLIEIKSNSSYIGVRIKNDKFQSNIKFAGSKGVYLGTYLDEHSAAYAYNKAFEHFHPESPVPNTIESELLDYVDKPSIEAYVKGQISKYTS